MMKLYTNGDWKTTVLRDENNNKVEGIKKITVKLQDTAFIVKVFGDIVKNISYGCFANLTVIKVKQDENGYFITLNKTCLKMEKLYYKNVLICKWEEYKP